MTKEDLVKNCLRFLNYRIGSVFENTETESYSVPHILESIKRALHTLEFKRKLPLKTITINYVSPSSIVQVDLNNANIIFRGVLKQLESGGKITIDCIDLKNNLLTLPPLCENEAYLIYGDGKFSDSEFDNYDFNNTQLPYGDDVLNCIPYFVKAEVVEEENAQLSVYNRNLFETYAEQLGKNKNEYRGNPIDVYGLY